MQLLYRHIKSVIQFHEKVLLNNNLIIYNIVVSFGDFRFTVVSRITNLQCPESIAASRVTNVCGVTLVGNVWKWEGEPKKIHISSVRPRVNSCKQLRYSYSAAGKQKRQTRLTSVAFQFGNTPMPMEDICGIIKQTEYDPRWVEEQTQNPTSVEYSGSQVIIHSAL